MNILTLIMILAALVVLGTVGTGIYFIQKDIQADRPRLKKFLHFNLVGFIPVMAAALIMFAPSAVGAASQGAAAISDSGLGYIGAALSTGLACCGAGYAVGVVGSAALGAVSENEGILGKTLIYVGLAEGVAIYGLIISIMIIGTL